MKILVGIATTNASKIVEGKVFKTGPDRRFIETLPNFFNECGKRFPGITFESMWVWNKPLVDAQNDFAERLLEGGHDYLLTLEDDHWAMTADMLEACLRSEKHVCGIPYRSRHFPFEVVPMKFARFAENGLKKFSGMNDPSLKGYQECDLLGFGFTLIKAECFRILDRPYFRLNTERYPGAGPCATDIDFCERLIDKDIIPVGCFDYRLNHRDLQEDKYKELLVEGILTQHSMFTTVEGIHKHKLMNAAFKKRQKENEKLKGTT